MLVTVKLKVKVVFFSISSYLVEFKLCMTVCLLCMWTDYAHNALTLTNLGVNLKEIMDALPVMKTLLMLAFSRMLYQQGV